VPGLDGLARDAVRRYGIPGVAVAGVDAGVVADCAAAGFADLASGTPISADGACNWFSMTKIATATAAMVLAERGAVDLGEPVGAYLGDLWPRAFARVRVATC